MSEIPQKPRKYPADNVLTDAELDTLVAMEFFGWLIHPPADNLGLAALTGQTVH